jgi:hypothetical protein
VKEITPEGIKDFARRVEALCNHLRDDVPHSEDRDALDRLRDQAADLQFAPIKEAAISGLADVLR